MGSIFSFFSGRPLKSERLVSSALMLPLCLASSCMPIQEGRVSSPALAVAPRDSKPPIKKDRLQLPDSLPERVEAWKRIVDEVIKKNGTSFFGSSECDKFTEEWVKAMHFEFGISLHYSMSEHQGVAGLITTKNGKEIKWNYGHSFATDRGLCKTSDSCAEEIIIDASYLQFVEGGECRVDPKLETCQFLPPTGDLPPVLVGSQAQVIEFYSNLKQKLQIPGSSWKESLMEWLPHTFPSFIYSFGINSYRRIDMPVKPQ